MRQLDPTLIRVNLDGNGRAIGAAIREVIARKSRPVLRIGSMMQIELSQPRVAQCFAVAFEEGRSVEIGACGLLAEKGQT